ncbi:MAG: DUF4870 domain-containing protein [Proteiniphilum sp.]|jgi:uncharacterized Tic20 family protein|nr:DUF4870 domain-containing protein [Proteiniphilum sp.]
MNIYEDLESLKRLLDEGVISQEEYEYERARILASRNVGSSTAWNLGIDERSFVALMHASQLLSSFIVPLVMWLLFRERSRLVDEAGKNILNFELSYLFYAFTLCVTCIGVVLLPAVGVIMIVFIVIAVIKAVNGEEWSYPLSIHILK